MQICCAVFNTNAIIFLRTRLRVEINHDWTSKFYLSVSPFICPRLGFMPCDFSNIFFKLILYNYIFLLNLKDLILREEERTIIEVPAKRRGVKD